AEQHYFTEHCLDIALSRYQTGVEAMKEMANGHIDIASAAEFVVARDIFERNDLKIVGAITTVDEKIRVVARKDHDLHYPFDIKDKKIGVVLKSSAEFFLSLFLIKNGLKNSDVALVNLAPHAMQQEIQRGNISAAVIWDPVANEVKKSLGENAISW